MLSHTHAESKKKRQKLEKRDNATEIIDLNNKRRIGRILFMDSQKTQRPGKKICCRIKLALKLPCCYFLNKNI